MHFSSLGLECRVVKQNGTHQFDNDRAVCNMSVVFEGLKEEKMFFNTSFFGNHKRVEMLGNVKPGSHLILSCRLNPETYKEKQQLNLTVYDFQFIYSDKAETTSGAVPPTADDAPVAPPEGEKAAF